VCDNAHQLAGSAATRATNRWQGERGMLGLAVHSPDGHGLRTCQSCSRLGAAPLRLQGANKGEERHALPPSLRGVPFNGLVGCRRLS
jgi:hypothetical protein